MGKREYSDSVWSIALPRSKWNEMSNQSRGMKLCVKNRGD